MLRSTMLQTLRAVAFIAAATFASVTHAADSEAWKKIVAAAKEEGTATIYSGQGLDQLNAFATRIKEEYGITLQVVRGLPSDLHPKIEAELKTGRRVADLYVISDLPLVIDLIKKGAVVVPLGPAFDDPAYDKKTRMPENTYFEAGASILTFSWNKDVYPRGLKDYPDIFDPALIGKIGIANPTGSLSQVDFYLYLSENYGPDFIKKLPAMKPRFYPGALPLAQAIISGEVGAAMTTRPLIEEQAKGAPVGWGLAPKAWGAIFYGVILQGAPHPNAAQVVADYMVTRRGQEAVARAGAAVLPDVKGTIANTASVRKPDYNKLTPEFFRTFVDDWKALFAN